MNHMMTTVFHTALVSAVTALFTRRTVRSGLSVSLRSWAKASRQRVYELLPQRAKVFASEAVSKYLSAPSVYHNPAVHPSRGLSRGAVVFSVDFELAWGWVHAKNTSVADAIGTGLRERAQVPSILAAMDEYMIPATWATVGHLFLDHCTRNGQGRAHAEMPRIPFFESEYYAYHSGDWFDADPCTDYKSDPAWYAPDLIEQVMAARAHHEIGCHSFAHESYRDWCPAEVAEAQIEACFQAMKPFGLVPRTWVFPGNEVGNFATLARKGIRSVRSFPVRAAQISLPIQRADGMWAIFDSSAVDLEGEGWHYAERLARLKRFVDAAAETKLAAHIWFHPSLPADQMHGLLFPLLKYCAEQREKGLIDVLTIDGLVDATSDALKKEGRL
jgi:peptidoglycan/xylan/chitin deacetylase (PgdA/CDA1 family)